MWLGRFSGTGFEFLSDPAASVCQEDLVLSVAALSVVFAMVEPERRSALAKAESRSPAPPPLSELSERRQVW